MARRYWPNGGAVGARIRLGPNDAAPWAQVIGIVGDVRNDPARPQPEPMTYASSRQDAWGSRTVILRTSGDPLALVKPVQRALSALDPTVAIRDPGTLRAIVSDRLSARRLPVVLMIAFGALALVLASVGVYAMFASMAAAREREFGVRVALGSSRGAIAGLVLRQGGVWMLAGLAAGAAGVVVRLATPRRSALRRSDHSTRCVRRRRLVLVLCAPSRCWCRCVGRPRADPISVLALAYRQTHRLLAIVRRFAVAPQPEFALPDGSRASCSSPCSSPPLIPALRGVRDPAYASDGRLVVSIDGDLYVQAANAGAWTRLTSGPAWDREPTWSRDGASIVFSSDRAGGFDLWRIAVSRRPGSASAGAARATDDVARSPTASRPSASDGRIIFVRGRGAAGAPLGRARATAPSSA